MYIILRAIKQKEGDILTPKDAKKPDPIFKFTSSIDLNNNNHIKFIGFEIPKPLPSELLNVMLKQEIFKRGKIGGKLTIDNIKTILY